MKEKRIAQHIARKVDDWLESIKDENVRNLAKENVIVTGGCIASMFLGEPIKDFDIYFRCKAAALEIAKYYMLQYKEHERSKDNAGSTRISSMCVVVKEPDETGFERITVMVKSAGIATDTDDKKDYQYYEGIQNADLQEAAVSGYLENATETLKAEEKAEEAEAKERGKYFPRMMTSNAITLSHKIQLVFRFYGEPDDIHANYDFVHCTNYWTSWDKKLTLKTDALSSLLAKDLKYVGSKYPVCSLIRVRKFLDRGWTCTAGEIVKMCFQVSGLDLTNINVLEDQLTGVDYAYFAQVIDIIKSDAAGDKLPKKEGQEGPDITQTYLIQLIDKIF